MPSEEIWVKLQLPRQLRDQLMREAGKRGERLSSYVAGSMQDKLWGQNHGSHIRTGGIAELCDLVHNFLQALYMFRGELKEEERHRLVAFIKDAVQDYARVRQALRRHHGGREKVQRMIAEPDAL